MDPTERVGSRGSRNTDVLLRGSKVTPSYLCNYGDKCGSIFKFFIHGSAPDEALQSVVKVSSPGIWAARVQQAVKQHLQL
jgi:hypothetical protein